MERLTSLLNTCKLGNLPAADQRELSSLITDSQSVCLSLLILHQARLSINNTEIPPRPPFSLNVNHFALTEYYMFSFLH